MENIKSENTIYLTLCCSMILAFSYNLHHNFETVINSRSYTDYAGLEIPVDLCIASPFSRQIAIGNAGPISALESMGPNQTFRCHFLNIGPSYKQ